MPRKRFREVPRDERPREKLKHRGPQALSDLELLAVLIGSGTRNADVFQVSERLLKAFDSNGNFPSIDDLCQLQGIGLAKASLVSAALEFARRRIRPHHIKISFPTDIYPLIRHIADRPQEHFLCVSLNGANEVIAVRTVSVGLVNRALVHPREVFADPITDRAAAIVVAHNHPSGTLTPSADDLAVTRQLLEAAQTLGIKLLDHIIFNHSSHYSLMEHGQL